MPLARSAGSLSARAGRQFLLLRTLARLAARPGSSSHEPMISTMYTQSSREEERLAASSCEVEMDGASNPAAGLGRYI
jgi:hypothetical protein